MVHEETRQEHTQHSLLTYLNLKPNKINYIIIIIIFVLETEPLSYIPSPFKICCCCCF